MWISKAEYRRMARQLDRAEKRAEQAEVALVEERTARMADVRHVLSMLLRAKNSYPLPASEPAAMVPPPAAEDAITSTEPMDPGEYEALLERAAEYGVSQPDVDRLLSRERGL